MKIIVHKQRNSISGPNRPILAEEILDEALPAVAAAAPVVGAIGSALGIGGDSEEEAEEIADAIFDREDIDPMNVTGTELIQHTKLLASIADQLKDINLNISKLPQDPDVHASNTPDPSDQAPASTMTEPKPEVARTQKRKNIKSRPREYKVVSEIKIRVNSKSELAV